MDSKWKQASMDSTFQLFFYLLKDDLPRQNLILNLNDQMIWSTLPNLNDQSGLRQQNKDIVSRNTWVLLSIDNCETPRSFSPFICNRTSFNKLTHML